jgi:Fatty acid cis/trans isomerase (CTI)
MHADVRLRSYLQSLATVRGESLSLMPEMSILRIDRKGNPPLYLSLLRNTGHANLTHFLLEKRALLPVENTLTVVRGVVGAYPNAIYRMNEDAVPAFEAAIRTLQTEQDYQRLADRYAVRRTSSEFWAISDALHQFYQSSNAVDAGILDYNRLENR